MTTPQQMEPQRLSKNTPTSIPNSSGPFFKKKINTQKKLAFGKILFIQKFKGSISQNAKATTTGPTPINCKSKSIFWKPTPTTAHVFTAANALTVGQIPSANQCPPQKHKSEIFPSPRLFLAEEDFGVLTRSFADSIFCQTVMRIFGNFLP